jgi:hypothetical protein
MQATCRFSRSREVGPDQPVTNVCTLEDVIAASVAQRRLPHDLRRQLLESVLDDDDPGRRGRRRASIGVLDHQEAPAIGGDVVGTA